ncbi:OpgC domain-containing protein [Paracoccus sp. 1_MG-2023]|uniref:OpgC domain-containing protein n=1 Tax=unclassified Paracoccus (in: a-proteobacteria) TaxID=2688777 RepID=UPI001C09593A|nr:MULTISPECIES: OpgC domain-containing protein [unclassified Paracoccus (in: a-proteobacteria)]MBU2959220.1 OpgC domain-containing protein [Paracoccus sp. C2R09]MDO6670330.1 OpgC domain-containing protein [Paracoccus sp. 1_MG-2023]
MNRIITLDMLRGYALVSIMVNHMPISAMRHVTLPNFSIFDASEMFVLLSGFLVGMVWRGIEAKQGRGRAQRRFLRRAFEVWRAMVVGALLMGLLSALLWSVDLPHTAIWDRYAVWSVDHPLLFMAEVGSFWLQPNIIDVLAVYVVLIALTPLVVPAMLRAFWLCALVSVVLWWFAPPLNQMLPNHRTQGGFLFNPFGWQMLFYTGTALGLFRERIMETLWPHRHLVTAIAAAMFAFGATIVIASRIGEPALPLRRALKMFYGNIDKWSLDGTRYLAILSAAWLIAVPLARPAYWFSATRIGVALQQIGKGGLFSFVACVLLSVLGDALQMTPADQPMISRLAIDIWACITLWWISAQWLEHGAPWQKARKARKA